MPHQIFIYFIAKRDNFISRMRDLGYDRCDVPYYSLTSGLSPKSQPGTQARCVKIEMQKVNPTKFKIYNYFFLFSEVHFVRHSKLKC
jgi:hypothetical protein